MSRTQPVSEGDAETPAVATPANPYKNPSYPQRTHTNERSKWQAVLQTCEGRIASAAAKRDAVPQDSPRRPVLDRLFAQMQGARDQVADAARRLPGEAGDLYEEDKHRLEEAVASLERVLTLWESQ